METDINMDSDYHHEATTTQRSRPSISAYHVATQLDDDHGMLGPPEHVEPGRAIFNGILQRQDE